jgi:hypothetical protein
MNIRTMFGAMLMTLICSQAKAEIIIGAGTKSCGAYNEVLKSPMEALHFQSWALGYLSGLNGINGGIDFLEDVDSDGIIGALRMYCKSHPLDQFDTAAGNVYGQLIARAIAKAERRKKR